MSGENEQAAVQAGGGTAQLRAEDAPLARQERRESSAPAHSTTDGVSAYQSDGRSSSRTIVGNPVGSVADGPKGSHVEASGGFSPSHLTRIDEALTLASDEAGLTFSLYVGNLSQPTRAAAEGLFDQLVAGGVDAPVLVAVSPGQRVLHIVTGEVSGTRLSNRACALAALAMRASFSSGDLTGGIVTGLRMLADAAGRGSRRTT